MTKLKEYRLAIQLRKKGKSYSQIKKELKLSKSTLSRWLKNYPLSISQLRELRDINDVRIEKYRKTRQKQRNKQLSYVYNLEKKKILPFSKKNY